MKAKASAVLGARKLTIRESIVACFMQVTGFILLPGTSCVPLQWLLYTKRRASLLRMCQSRGLPWILKSSDYRLNGQMTTSGSSTIHRIRMECSKTAVIVSAGAATNIRISTSPRQTNDGLSLLNISETASYRGIWPTQTAKQLVGATPTQRPIA